MGAIADVFARDGIEICRAASVFGTGVEVNIELLAMPFQRSQSLQLRTRLRVPLA